MEKLMALQKYIRQLRPIQENKVDYVERFQDLFEAKGLNIDENCRVILVQNGWIENSM